MHCEDIVFCDPIEGVVVIPKELGAEVVGFLPGHLRAENAIKAAVKDGMSVSAAFTKYR